MKSLAFQIIACMLSSVTLFATHGLKPAKLICPWIFQARILEWLAISYSRGSSRPRDWTHFSCTSRQNSLPLYHLVKAWSKSQKHWNCPGSSFQLQNFACLQDALILNQNRGFNNIPQVIREHRRKLEGSQRMGTQQITQRLIYLSDNQDN